MSESAEKPLSIKPPNTPSAPIETPASIHIVSPMPPVDVSDLSSPPLSKPISRRFSAGFSYSGPLPPPEMLAKYEDIQPGLVERIMRMAESQSQHIQSEETAYREGTFGDMRRCRIIELSGQLCGLVIAVISIAGSLITICIRPTGIVAGVASIITGATLVSIVAAFLAGRKGEKTVPGARQKPSEKNKGSPDTAP